MGRPADVHPIVSGGIREGNRPLSVPARTERPTYSDAPAKLARRIVIEQLRNLVRLLGRTPTTAEVDHYVDIGWSRIGRLFARHRRDCARGYRRAMRLAGAVPRPAGRGVAESEGKPKVERQLRLADARLARKREIEATAIVALTRRCEVCGGRESPAQPHHHDTKRAG